jgi:hypothetical protein
VYDDGTGNAVALPLDRLTDAPPVGAAPVNVSVTVPVCPEVTVEGLTPITLNATAPAAGVTVTLASWTTPPHPASDCTVVELVTGPVVTVKLALVCPAGIVYGDCTGSAVRFPLPTSTCAPPAGAGPLKVNVNVTVPPEVTVDGAMVYKLMVTVEAGGFTVTAADWLTPL